MKLLKQELNKVSRSFNLGKVKSIKYIPAGTNNYSYNVKTEKGNFIVRTLGYKLNKFWKEKKELQFGVVDYLHKKKFSYSIPKFIKNKNGKYISKINGNLFEAYERIPGRKIKYYKDINIKEIIKAMATYHKVINNFHAKKKFCKIDNYKWIPIKFTLMRKVKPKNNVDKLMLKHLENFENLIAKLLKVNINQNPLITHSDFNYNNLLWNGDKLVGIIDFENVSYKSKASDIASIYNNTRGIKKLANLYRRYNSLSRKEESIIIVFKLLHTCNLFWWSYLEMKKRPELRYKYIGYAVHDYKKYTKLLKN